MPSSFRQWEGDFFLVVGTRFLVEGSSGGMKGILGKTVIGGKPSVLISQQTHFDGAMTITVLRKQDRPGVLFTEDECLREEYFLVWRRNMDG